MGLQLEAVPFEEGVEPIAKGIKRLAGGRGKSIAQVSRQAGLGDTGLYDVLNGKRRLRVTHLAQIARSMDYAETGAFLADLGNAMGQTAPRTTPQAPRDAPAPALGEIPVSEHRAVIRALDAAQRHIATLEATPPDEQVRRLHEQLAAAQRDADALRNEVRQLTDELAAYRDEDALARLADERVGSLRGNGSGHGNDRQGSAR